MKKIFNSFLSLFTFLSLFLQTQVAYADNLCPQSGDFTRLCSINAGNLPSTVGKIVTILLILAIILTLLYLIYGGIKWITSGGDKGKVDAARSHITAAIVGLIIALLSFFILNVITYVFVGKAFNEITFPTLFP